MWRRIKIQLIKIIPYSMLIALFLQMGWDYPFALTSMATLLINLCLLASLWYSEKIRRPVMWQMMMILFIAIAVSCLSGWGISELLRPRGYDIEDLKPISILLLISCFTTTVMERKALKEQIAWRIDLWIPPMWSIVGGVLLLLLLDANEELMVRRLCIVIVAMALIMVAGNKCNRRDNKAITYEIDRRGYLKALASFAIGLILITVSLPVANALPGTKWIRGQVDNLWEFRKPSNDLETRLSRNPSQSKAVVLTITADEPLYLRRRAYTIYSNGAWQVGEEKKNIWTPFDGEGIYREYDLVRFFLQEIEAGEIFMEGFNAEYQEELALPLAQESRHSAVIRESEAPVSYLSVNGLTEISLENNSLLGDVPSDSEVQQNEVEQDEVQAKVGYIGRLENLYFTNLKSKAQNEYTIEYIDYELGEGTRENALLKSMAAPDLMRVWGEAYGQSYELGRKVIERGNSGYAEPSFKERYMQIPKEIDAQITQYASRMIRGHDSELEQAEAICNQLKYSGEYTYKLGAAYEDVTRDPVVDFLLYGKQGICQDFASGMVLLCRSIGLPARYVTGYYASERGEGPNEYIVREKDAHAFVEVYITGYGWMTFDPTTSIEARARGVREVTLKWGEIELPKLDVMSLLIILGVLIGLWKYPIKWMRSWVWCFWLLRRSPGKIIEVLMDKTLRLLEQKGYERQNDETLSQFTERLAYVEIDIHPITKPFETYYYGKQTPSLHTLRSAYHCYNELTKKKTWRKSRQTK